MTKILKIYKSFPTLKYDGGQLFTEPFIVNTGYLRLVIDSTYIDKDSAAVLIKIGGEPNLDNNDGYLLVKGVESILKIDAPKKFVGTKIYPNFSTTLISFSNNGNSVEHPFKLGEYVTITGAVDDSYNQSLVHAKISGVTNDTISVDVDMSGYSELNSGFVVNLSNRMVLQSPNGNGTLNVTEVYPIS